MVVCTTKEFRRIVDLSDSTSFQCRDILLKVKGVALNLFLIDV